MRPELLSDLHSSVKNLNGWSLSADGKTISKSYTFKDFKEAFAFMTKAGAIADAMDHHPDWTNVYNKVDIRLSTHDKGGLTNLDIELAQKIDSIQK